VAVRVDARYFTLRNQAAFITHVPNSFSHRSPAGALVSTRIPRLLLPTQKIK
jgi:hypothetical protein